MPPKGRKDQQVQWAFHDLFYSNSSWKASSTSPSRRRRGDSEDGPTHTDIRGRSCYKKYKPWRSHSQAGYTSQKFLRSYPSTFLNVEVFHKLWNFTFAYLGAHLPSLLHTDGTVRPHFIPPLDHSIMFVPSCTPLQLLSGLSQSFLSQLETLA